MRRCLLFCGLAACCVPPSLTTDLQAEETPASNQPAEFLAVPESSRIQFRPTAGESNVPEPFRRRADVFEAQAKYERTSGPVRVFRIQFPSPVKTALVENNTVHGHYFQPQGPGPHPGCVVLHILGGEFALSQMIANSLARRGVAALFIKMPYYGERRGKDSRRRMISRDPRETAAGMTQAVLDIRRAADWLAHRREVDADRLGVTGISLGGIMSALSAAAEPRFRKVAIYLGGGQLGPYVWDNPHPQAETFRRDWLAGGETRESFLKILAPVDPAVYGHLLKDRQVLMVAAEHDEIIPRRCTLALWESIGKKPELVWLDAGHISAAQFLYGEVERLGKFFNPPAKSKSATTAAERRR